MRRVAVLIAVLLLGAAGPAWAQAGGIESAMELGGRKMAVSPGEMRALLQLGNVIGGGTRAEQDRALLAARRIANSPDARYALATYEFELGRKRADEPLQARALDALLASDLLPPARVPGHLGVRGQLALKAGDTAGAERAWTRLVLLQPGEPGHLLNLAQVSAAARRWPEAAGRLQKAIALKKAAGGAAPEAWYRQRLGIAQRGRLTGEGIDAALALVAAYPAPANWRAALMVFLDLAAPTGEAEIDLLRLMRATAALQQAAEVQRLAQLLRQAGAAAEAKAVLSEGVTRGLIDPATSPTREIAAEIDRALARGSANAPSSRAAVLVAEGRAHLAAGRRAEAARSFEAAAALPPGGAHADVARFWRLWALGSRP